MSYGLTTRYGRFAVGHEHRPAHRVAYELQDGRPVANTLEIDHLCRVHNCVRPEHLEPVPHRVNALRGFSIPAENARKTHCTHGHAFTMENTRGNYTLTSCKCGTLPRAGWR